MSKAKCKNCGTIIESKHKHDFVVCLCFEDKFNTKGIFLDGGNNYIRYGGNLKNFELIEPKIEKSIKRLVNKTKKFFYLLSYNYWIFFSIISFLLACLLLFFF